MRQLPIPPTIFRLIRAFARPALAVLLLASTACTINFSFNNNGRPLDETTLRQGSADKIAVIPITGLISSNNSRGVVSSGPSPLALLESRLRLAAQDDQVKAVLLSINSPGGTVTASDLVYHQLRNFHKQSGKPVVAQMLDLATSGGYYAALGANRIHALPTSLTCSIGVIVVRVSVAGLLERNGIEVHSYASGDSKDLGAPYQPGSDRADKFYQPLVDSFGSIFFSLVKERRPRATGREYVRGGVCTARQALDYGLIDAISYPDDTIAQIAVTHGLSANPSLVSYTSQSRQDSGFYGTSAKASLPWLAKPLPQQIHSQLTPGLYYLSGW